MTTSWTAHCSDIECGGCANSIKNSLGKLLGVQTVDVDLTSKDVTVTFDTEQTSSTALQQRLASIGFPPR